LEKSTSVAPSTSSNARCPGAPKAVTVARRRRSRAASSCASAAERTAPPRFTPPPPLGADGESRRGLRLGTHRGLGDESEAREQARVALDVGVAGGEQLLAVEDRVRAGEEAERLQLVAHRLAPGREPYVRARHEEARDGDGAHEIEGIDVRDLRERRA